MAYTYKIQYNSYEESPQWTFTSNKKYTNRELRKILHDAIIEFIENNPRINAFDWEGMLYERGGNNPILQILQEKYDLTICQPQYTAKVTYWGWSRVSTEDPQPDFKQQTPLWQQQTNNELAEIFKERDPTPYIDGLFFQYDDE